MAIELKICGINSEKIIQTIATKGGCKYLGFIFYPPSPRNLTVEKSKKLTSSVPAHIKKVAVLVNPDNSFVEKIKNLTIFYTIFIYLINNLFCKYNFTIKVFFFYNPFSINKIVYII